MGKIVKLNNFLPPEIQEDVMKEQPLLMHHTHLQKAFDENVKPGDYVELEGTFNIDKLVGYKPEWYGTDNRPVTNATHLTMHGSQPCFSIELNNNVINFSGATFIVHRMFNDGLGIRGFKGQNQIHLGNWYTRRILDVDPNGLAATDRSVLYSNPAKRWIPPIDGTSGSSIKGTKEAGFNVTVNNFELSKFRSNSLDTSKMTDELAGYNPTYGKHYGGGNYPQDDGTTAPTWGTWEKGWFGNFHAAIFINQNHTYTQRERDMAKLVITGGYIRGFVYAGIEFPVRNDVTTDGVEFKCRINALGKNGVGTLISSGENTFISVVYRSDPKIYVLVSSMKINVNGTEYLPKTDIPITLKSVEYHIKFNTPVIKGRNRIRLGAPYNGNNQLTEDFWEINIHRGKDIMTVSG